VERDKRILPSRNLLFVIWVSLIQAYSYPNTFPISIRPKPSTAPSLQEILNSLLRPRLPMPVEPQLRAVHSRHSPTLHPIMPLIKHAEVLLMRSEPIHHLIHTPVLQKVISDWLFRRHTPRVLRRRLKDPIPPSRSVEVSLTLII
jgi:hypothetical protein